jgi:hypothetical protein
VLLVLAAAHATADWVSQNASSRCAVTCNGSPALPRRWPEGLLRTRGTSAIRADRVTGYYRCPTSVRKDYRAVRWRSRKYVRSDPVLPLH